MVSALLWIVASATIAAPLLPSDYAPLAAGRFWTYSVSDGSSIYEVTYRLGRPIEITYPNIPGHLGMWAPQRGEAPLLGYPIFRNGEKLDEWLIGSDMGYSHVRFESFGPYDPETRKRVPGLTAIEEVSWQHPQWEAGDSRGPLRLVELGERVSTKDSIQSGDHTFQNCVHFRIGRKKELWFARGIGVVKRITRTRGREIVSTLIETGFEPTARARRVTPGRWRGLSSKNFWLKYLSTCLDFLSRFPFKPPK